MKLIEFFRKQKGRSPDVRISKSRLARLIGVTPSMITKYADGDYLPIRYISQIEIETGGWVTRFDEIPLCQSCPFATRPENTPSIIDQQVPRSISAEGKAKRFVLRRKG